MTNIVWDFCQAFFQAKSFECIILICQKVNILVEHVFVLKKNGHNFRCLFKHAIISTIAHDSDISVLTNFKVVEFGFGDDKSGAIGLGV